MIVICAACRRHAEARVSKRAKLRCSNCGASAVILARVLKPWMVDGGQRDPAEARALVHASLVSIARERGFSSGWVLAKYRQIFDVWPPRYVDPEPRMPSGELLRWLKLANKAYARTMDAREDGAV